MNKFRVLSIIKKITFPNLYKKDINLDCNFYGNEYGGFFVVDNELNDESIILSFGIGEDISFDLGLIKKFGCKVYGFDPTPQAKSYIDSLKNIKKFFFFEFGVASKSSDQVKFYVAVDDTTDVSASIYKQSENVSKNFIYVKMLSMNDIINEIAIKKIDLLKIDIEGAEYELLEKIGQWAIKPKQIVLEFHDRFFYPKLKSLRIIKILRKEGYNIFSISQYYTEFSFIKS